MVKPLGGLETAQGLSVPTTTVLSRGGTMTNSRPEYHGRTALYRLYDSTGQLLYVGVSNDPEERWKSHEHYQFWWLDVVRKEVVWLPTRAAARAAEDRAIRTEKPLYDRSNRRARLSEEELQARRQERTDQAAAVLERAIQAGELPFGTMLPSERVLKVRYGFSADVTMRATHALQKRGLVTFAGGCCYIVHDPETFPRDLAHRYGLLYVLGIQAFGQESFTVAEIRERTRLPVRVVDKDLLKLRRTGLAVEAGRRTKAGQRWVLRPAPPAPVYEPVVEFEIGLG